MNGVESVGVGRHVLPEGLDEMAPGPELGRLLAGIDRRHLNGHDLVILLQARTRQLSYEQAEQYADMVELGYCPPSCHGSAPERQAAPDEFVVDEIRAALSWTRRAADNAFDLAWRLVERLPRVWEALHAGRIDLLRARVMVHATDHLNVVLAREVVDQVLDQAHDLTTGQISARLRKLSIETDPDDAKKRYEQGLDERRVISEPNPDGTANLLGFNLPADRVAAIMAKISELARKLRRSDDARTMDQLRVDIFLEILEGIHHNRHTTRRPTIDIRVALTTLLGLDDKAGEIPGWGPVIADIARQAVERQPNGEWRIVVTDPDNGAVLWNGTTRRRPSAAQRRWVEARQPTCVMKGCRMPAQRCDIDHIQDYAKGGPSLVHNYDPDCRHDHNLQTIGGWKLTQPRPGVYIWTSRHGHTYRVTHPPDT